jgi:hypothetical protein
MSARCLSVVRREGALGTDAAVDAMKKLPLVDCFG